MGFPVSACKKQTFETEDADSPDGIGEIATDGETRNFCLFEQAVKEVCQQVLVGATPNMRLKPKPVSKQMYLSSVAAITLPL